MTWLIHNSNMAYTITKSEVPEESSYCPSGFSPLRNFLSKGYCDLFQPGGKLPGKSKPCRCPMRCTRWDSPTIYSHLSHLFSVWFLYPSLIFLLTAWMGKTNFSASFLVSVPQEDRLYVENHHWVWEGNSTISILSSTATVNRSIIVVAGSLIFTAVEFLFCLCSQALLNSDLVFWFYLGHFSEENCALCCPLCI